MAMTSLLPPPTAIRSPDAMPGLSMMDHNGPPGRPDPVAQSRRLNCRQCPSQRQSIHLSS